MNPMTEKQLEKMLRQAPSGGDLDRAVQGVLARRRARRPDRRRLCLGRLPLRQAAGRPDRSRRGPARPAEPSRRPAHRRRGPRGPGERSSRRGCSSRPQRLDEERRELEDYFEGKRDHFDVPVDWKLTPAGFRNRALHAVARIPYGETRTYGRDRQAGRQPARLPRRRHRLRPQPDPADRPLPPRGPDAAAASATTAAARR